LNPELNFASGILCCLYYWSTKQKVMENQVTISDSSIRGRAALRIFKAGSPIFVLFLIGLFFLPWMWRQAVQIYYGSQIHTVESIAPSQVAIVFGAAVYSDGRLSSVLRDRMDTAITLYKSGKVEKLLVSGDNSADHYNEPGAMMNYAIRNGVVPADIQPDYAGLRTYDTCYRARNIFQIEEAILVTQAFHLPRAIFTCQQLGIVAAGTVADLRPYRGASWYEFREVIATTRALWDVLRREPSQILGDTIPLQ
jgi:SanA protein